MPIDLAPGTVFAGDYRVVRRIGEGGMGAVFEAEQMSTGAPRALKLMHRHLVEDPRLRVRFEQEARVGARIESDHVTQVLAAGIDAATGMPWMAMELLQGETLASHLERRPVLPPGDVREVFDQLCHAVAAGHAVGVVHRDIKPENVFLAVARRRGVPFTLKVLDFGIAKVVAEAKTATAALGTPIWMAPEQVSAGTAIGPPTDVWALGLIAFRLLVGQYFWLGAADESASVQAVMREVLFDPIPAASQRAHQYGRAHLVPPGFDTWLAYCLAREPAARFPEAGRAFAALDPILSQAAGFAPGAGARISVGTPAPAGMAPTAVTPAGTPYATPAGPAYAAPAAVPHTTPAGPAYAPPAAIPHVTPAGFPQGTPVPATAVTPSGGWHGASAPVRTGPTPYTAVPPTVPAAGATPATGPMTAPGGAPAGAGTWGAAAHAWTPAGPQPSGPSPAAPPRSNAGIAVGIAAAVVVAGGAIAAAIVLRGRGDEGKDVPPPPSANAAASASGGAARDTAVLPEAAQVAMIRFPGGSFQMGADDGRPDERPVHEMVVPPFDIDRTEVTVAAYEACAGAGKCDPSGKTIAWPGITDKDEATWSPFCNLGREGRGTHPMNCASWDQAKAYCEWAGKRLPLEEEWEYAARGRDRRRYPWGADAPGPRLLNGCGTECRSQPNAKALGLRSAWEGDDGWPDTAPVGGFAAGATPEGVHDMAGNVWEWTGSAYCPYGRRQCGERARAVRGGGWYEPTALTLRGAARQKLVATGRFVDVGFRCAK